MRSRVLFRRATVLFIDNKISDTAKKYELNGIYQYTEYNVTFI